MASVAVAAYAAVGHIVPLGHVCPSTVVSARCRCTALGWVVPS